MIMTMPTMMIIVSFLLSGQKQCNGDPLVMTVMTRDGAFDDILVITLYWKYMGMLFDRLVTSASRICHVTIKQFFLADVRHCHDPDFKSRFSPTLGGISIERRHCCVKFSTLLCLVSPSFPSLVFAGPV